MAETLITLAIIGVVAALTMPSLVAHYKNLTYVTQLHKFYNELSQALMRYKTDNNSFSITEAGLTINVSSAENLVKSYFKIINSCDTDTIPCMAAKYKKMSGTNISLDMISALNRKCYTLSNGLGLCTHSGRGNVLSQISVDVNGAKGPNIAGRDLFIMYIYNDGKIDDLKTTCKNDTDIDCTSWYGTNTPLTPEERENIFNQNCNNKGYGYHECFGKILNDNWQMKY